MSFTYSPLRYPGGKHKYWRYVKSLIEKNGSIYSFVEIFGGGSGLGLALYKNKVIDQLIINEKDHLISNFWKVSINNPGDLISLIEKAKIDIKALKYWQELYKNKSFINSCNDTEKAFGFLFINRVVRSGIYNAGPIGGWKQNGNYSINARFNKDQIIRKINYLSSNKENIKIYNKDYRSFVNNNLLKNSVFSNRKNILLYLDPPYFKNGKVLYNCHFKHKDHVNLSLMLKKIKNWKWLLSYDRCEEIKSIFNDYKRIEAWSNNTVGKSKKVKELLFISEELKSNFGSFGGLIIKEKRRRNNILTSNNKL